MKSSSLRAFLSRLYLLWPVFFTALTTAILRVLFGALSIQVIALLYLIPVLVSAARWGWAAGILAAVLVFFSFNYFFIPPYGNLSVHQPQDVLTLAIFLVVAATISQLLGQAKQALAAASSREREATSLYELSTALAGLQSANDIACTLANHARATFNGERVEVFLAGRGGEEPILESTGGETKGSGLTSASLQTARGVEGEIRVWRARSSFSSQEVRLLQTFASQTALSLERVRLAKSENRARVLEESDQLKSALLSSVSHELRSPLATIKASVSSLRSGEVEWDLDARMDLLTAVEEETDHLNLLVGNLLAMSRIETGSLKPQYRWNSLAEIIAATLQRTSLSMADHTVQLDLSRDLPLIPSDFILMEQVFTNLLSNSAKYAPSGTKIVIQARLIQGNVLVQVINQSPALSEEDLSRIFEKFHRVTAADRVTGTGLGLSICRGIVEAHQGKIWAENTPEGFAFKMLLPITLEGELPKLPEEQSDEQTTPDPGH